MAQSVFVDTVAWIALMNRSDSLHAAASQVLDALRSQRIHLVTTEFVLLEVADALSAPPIRGRTSDFIEGLRELPTLDIVPASSRLFSAGLKLYRERGDKGWGLTDCTSFVVMHDRGVARAFTSDHHFTQAGFEILLRG